MSNSIRIKRRLSGSPGAPASLLGSEVAFNEVDEILYYGKGIASGVTAASIIAIGGSGYVVTLASAQTITGNKTFNGSVAVPTVAGADNSTNAASTAWTRLFAQPLSATLTALAALATTGIHVQTGAATYAVRSLVGTSGRIAVTNGDGVAANPTFDLATVTDSGTGTSFKKVAIDTYGRVSGTVAVGSGDITTALGFTPINVNQLGAASGVATLGSDGKVTPGQLPAAVTGSMQYIGTWNASTNTPTLANGVGTKGYYYKVGTAGNTTIDGNSNWTVGDMICFDGTTWDKFEGGSPDVVSVAGRIGAVVLTNTDISGLGTMATQNAAAVAITGGSVAGSTITGNIGGNAANVTGVVSAANGGTGAATLTGYVKGTGTGVMTASATIPNADVAGLGSMALQGAGAVAITGGTIDGITFDGGTF